jgi:hypothetical protein
MKSVAKMLFSRLNNHKKEKQGNKTPSVCQIKLQNPGQNEALPLKAERRI